MDSLSTEIINDSLQVAEKSSESDWILHHSLDARYLDFDPFIVIPLPHIELFGIDISITKHLVYMWVAAIFLFFLLYNVAKKYKKQRVPTGFASMTEIMILFVRDEIAKPTIHKGYEKFVPYLLSAFFFILTLNLFSLIPYGTAVTGNISVTATLAVFTFIVTQLGGIQNNGFVGYFKGLVPHGIPTWLLPIMIVVELLGLFTKPFALAVRLFANMLAGKIIIYSLIGLIFIIHTYFVVPVSVSFALFIFILKLLVSLIQAYIFTMLSSLFIGMAVHQDH
ncbi:MAG: F0F1 ATP synthase subunit A [Melioribacteraceae bacterium]|nr:F0F1 ATP synthase subunit A [Melioribacteraceae bacterium]